MRLEVLIAAAVGVGAPGVLLDSADYVRIQIGYPLALGHRVLVHPVDPVVLLHCQQTASLIHISTHPAASVIQLSHYLTAQYGRTQIISDSAVIILDHPQPVAIVRLI